MIRAMALKLNTGTMRRNGFVNKSKLSATCTSDLRFYTRKVFDVLRNSLAQSVNWSQSVNWFGWCAFE